LSEFINEIEFLHKLSRREKRFIVKWFLFRAWRRAWWRT